MKAYQSLIKEALAQGFSIDVYSEEGLEVDNSTSYDEVNEMVEALDDLPVLRFYDSDRCYRGSATVNLFVDDDETVMDHSMNHTAASANPKNSDRWIQDWWDKTIN
jgi:hypothetical protein